MTLNPNWPLMFTQVAFNAGLNTTNAPSWTDLTPRMWSLGCDRGRQYEIDQNQAGTAQLVLADRDEALNPTNPSSPYSPNVLPYRPICVQAMWPPAPAGAAVNLINAASGQDPTFESYAVGTLPSWLTGVGGTSPAVTTTNPQQGAQDLTWNTVGSATVQGVQTVGLATIPGQQYTASAYLRQSSASTQGIGAQGVTTVVDKFGRTVSSGWGSPTTGPAWTTAGGSASDYSVAAGVGVQSNGTVGVLRTAFIDTAGADVDVYVDVSLSIASATGANATSWVCGRLVDANNFYSARLALTSTGSVTLLLLKNVAGTLTTIVAAVTVGTGHAAGDWWRVRLQCTGSTIQAKAWTPATALAEPLAWTVSAVDTSLSTGTKVGLLSRLEAGNTNTLPVVCQWDNLQVVATVAGTSTTTVGAYVRLAVTFTATQPTHSIQVATIATAVAGTSNLDAVQLEQGATVSTFATTGPTIYGLHRGYVERWPSSWMHNGMYGYCQMEAVDAYAALAAKKLHSEYRNTVMAMAPDYYWPLNESQASTQFGEQSGKNGPALTRADYGSGSNTWQAGASTSILGDPSGTGIQNNNPGFTDGFTDAQSTIVALGGTGTWANTYTCWYQGGATSFDGYILCLTVGTPISGVLTALYVWFPTEVEFKSFANLVVATGPGTADLTDGKPHLLVATVSVAAGNVTITLVVDGVTIGTASGNAVSVFGWPSSDLALTSIGVGGLTTAYSYPQFTGPDCTISHVAAWRRALTGAEIANLWTAGQGYPGETSDTRVARYLANNYKGATAVDPGLSTMGVSNLAEGTILLDACQAVAVTENGNFWADGTGAVVFASRSRRYTATTAVWRFGEDQPGGENPYEDDVAFDFDPQLIYNDVEVANAGGITATAQDATSQASYGPRSYQRDVNVLSTNEAIDAANWLLLTHKDPRQRVANLVIKPSANPALWPVALGAEIGDRVTVKRRTTAGYTMSADFFIEQISHNQTPDSWTTSFQMSPALAQPGLLDSATLGLLDSTMVLAY